MPAVEKFKSARKPTNLSLDSGLLREAKALGINISRAALEIPGIGTAKS